LKTLIGGTGRETARSRRARRALPLALVVGCLVGVGVASADTPGSTTTTTTTTTTPSTTTTGVPGAPAGLPLGPTGTATLLSNGKALPPPNAPLAVRNAIRAANRIHKKTYIWGGGHRGWKARGYDCSGAVSYVLHAAGLLSAPLVSGQLARWGSPGTGNWITVYANRTHVFMVVAGLRFDTSPVGESLNQGRGPRWRQFLRSGTGYAIRYSPGL
jgi:hypothetical protein